MFLILGVALLVPTGPGFALGERKAAVACALAALTTLVLGPFPPTRSGPPNFFRREDMSAVEQT